ncbi:MAG: hypothetical protein IPN19_02390 [Elusimicrobia bacterium]|nr:hypothetical protein [Elusimicrobiota bacterium]
MVDWWEDVWTLGIEQGYKARVSVNGSNNWAESGEVYTWAEVPVGVNAQAAVGDPTGNVKFGWGHGTNGGEGTKYKVEITTQAGVWPLVGDANYMGWKRILGATSTGMVVSLANRQYFARAMALALDGDSTHDSGWTDGTTSTWTAVVGPQEVGCGGEFEHVAGEMGGECGECEQRGRRDMNCVGRRMGRRTGDAVCVEKTNRLTN